MNGELVTELVIPDGVSKIKNFAFLDCSGLTSVTIPNSVTSIGDWAFCFCSGLEEVHISDLTSWCNIDFNDYDSNPLYYAHNLYLNGELVTELVIPDGVSAIKNYAFFGCSELMRVDIVDGVKSIWFNAFAFCSNLEELYISNTIESIAYYAFEGCTNILEIKVGSKNAITCSENIFSEDVYNNALLCVPEGSKFAYEKTAPWNRFYIVETDYTDINGVKEQIAENNTVYDLQGRKVDNPTNGIYIVNGKKVFVK